MLFCVDGGVGDCIIIVALVLVLRWWWCAAEDCFLFVVGRIVVGCGAAADGVIIVVAGCGSGDDGDVVVVMVVLKCYRRYSNYCCCK